MVGALEKEYILHRDVLCQSSEFFVAACSHNWPEGREKRVQLAHADPGLFEVYAHWIYSRKVIMSFMAGRPEGEYLNTYLNYGEL